MITIIIIPDGEIPLDPTGLIEETEKLRAQLGDPPILKPKIGSTKSEKREGCPSPPKVTG